MPPSVSLSLIASRIARSRRAAARRSYRSSFEAKPWAPSDAPASYIDVILRGIIGFRFVITRLEGKWKMSQNREMEDRESVASGLKRRGDGDDLEMADGILRDIKPSG